jgi:hypothetical protein
MLEASKELVETSPSRPRVSFRSSFYVFEPSPLVSRRFRVQLGASSFDRKQAGLQEH